MKTKSFHKWRTAKREQGFPIKKHRSPSNHLTIRKFCTILQVNKNHTTVLRQTRNWQVHYKGERKEVLLSQKWDYLHKKVGEEALIDASRSQRRGQMLQAGGLQPPCHDRITGITGRPCIMQRPTAGVVIQSSRRSIALLHLATHVALWTSLGRQFSRSVYTRLKHIKTKKYWQHKSYKVKKSNLHHKSSKENHRVWKKIEMLTMGGKIEFKEEHESNDSKGGFHRICDSTETNLRI